MIVIAYEKGKFIGGYGDRIVGLVACKLMANLLNQKFYILWSRENIKKFINYDKYDFNMINITSKDIKLYDSIDKQTKFKKYLIEGVKLFPNKVNKFYLNQEIAQYLYKNKLFLNKNYLEDIYNIYKTLYTDILKPTNEMINIINNTIPKNIDIKNIIGIQIRAGDIYMVKDRNVVVLKNPDIEIKNILDRIKQHIEKDINNYYIFITSDYNNIFKISSEIWPNNLLYCNKKILHMDRNQLDDDLSKIFIDSYILSQKTHRLYISSYSNYGRISALSAIHNNIYDFKGNLIELKKLISKHEMIF